ncbi:MAG: urease accessory protein UreD [Panacagrimonas sp.]
MLESPAAPQLRVAVEAAAPTALPGTRRKPEWQAQLDLRIERRGDRTVLAHAHHHGPLRVQKPFYPESPGRMDLLILHPPAGIAGGDRLTLDVSLARGAQARITTPGASKWYRSDGEPAQQTLRIQVADEAVLEWLPQEAIVFDGARARTETDIACTETSRACGWDIWMLGRSASGESFRRGHVQQRTRLHRDGRLLWSERVNLAADDAIRTSPLGWNGANVMGSLWALGLPNDESLLERCREVAEPGVRIGITRFEHGLWLSRALGPSAERVRAALTRLWCLLRPALCGAAGVPPRIWAT